MKTLYLLLLTLPLLAIFASCVSRQYPVTSTYEETAYRTAYVSETYTENETAIETLSGQYGLTPFYSWYSPNIAFFSKTNVWYLSYDIPQSPPYDNIRLIISIWKQPQYESATLSVLDTTKGGNLSTPAPAVAGDSGKGQVKWTWITGTSSGSAAGGISDSWLDAANIQLNQALFLGGRTYLWSKQENPQIFQLDAGKAQKFCIILCGPQNIWNAKVSVDAAWSRNITSCRPVTKERQVARQVAYPSQKQQTLYETRQVPFWEIFLSPP